MNDEEFQRLATLYLEDAIDATNRELLNRELAESPSRVRQFNDLRLLTGLIHEHGRAAGQDRLVDVSTVDSHSPDRAATDRAATDRAARSGDLFGSTVVRPLQSSKRIAVYALLALATAASLLIVFTWPNGTSRQDVVPEIATLAYSSHARWADQDRADGAVIGQGRLKLEVGLARLDFESGATVTLQGPAEFEILSADRTRLSSGILTASIPESAVGFQVLTPAMDVVDLGTAFGVAVGVDGETDVCVFEGEVEVFRTGNEKSDATRLVSEGDAVRWSPDAESLASIEFDTIRYEEAWPVTSGVLQATGLMKFVAPGPSFVPGRYEDSERVLVFLEQTGVVPEADFFVDLVDPGQYQFIHRSESHRIQAGSRVRSYLLQLDPVGRLSKSAVNKPRVMGQVTFDAPVIGVIASSSKLNATDNLLGHPRGDYVKTRRGIEPPRPTDAPNSGRDLVILSDDRRTLSVDLSAGTAVDQIRVLVEEQR